MSGGKRILVTGPHSAWLIAVLALQGMEAVTYPDEFTLRREGPPCEDIKLLGCDSHPQTAYGPPRKGRGGKVKRW